MKRLVNAITCTRFVFALILVLVLRAWTPAPDVRGLLWIEKPRR